MNNSCKGCEWYGKPYFGINPPCNSCTRNTSQILTRWVDPTIEILYKENEELKDKIDKALEQIQLIIDIGFDYDGYNSTKNLKHLIDELVDYANNAKNYLK